MKFTTLIPNPDKLHDPKAQAIRQFNKNGLELIAEYYNQKYPQRAKIYQVLVDIEAQDLTLIKREAGDNPQNSEPDLANKLSLLAIEKIKSLEGENPRKILLTIGRGSESEHLAHSNPIIITDAKFILLRDEQDRIIQKIHHKIAEKLNLKLVQPKQNRPTDLINKTISIQADSVSCHMIAVGILKDIDNVDISKIIHLENGFEYEKDLAKILKYSQSTNFIYEFGKQALNSPVKNTGTTLEQYVVEGKSGEARSRIQTKRLKFINQLVNNESPSSHLIADIAKKMIDEKNIQKAKTN